MARRRSEPVQVSEVVASVLDDLGLRGDPVLQAVLVGWEQWVGEPAAAHCRPEALHAGILEVAVESSVWSQQLALRRGELLARLSQELGESAPREIWFRVSDR